MIWENGIEIRIISCMERVARPGSMHNTGCLGLVHWDDPEGWYGEGGGRRVQDGEHMYTYGGFIDIWQNQYNSVKFKNKIKKKKKVTLPAAHKHGNELPSSEHLFTTTRTFYWLYKRYSLHLGREERNTN